jgi:hypothetical protein
LDRAFALARVDILKQSRHANPTGQDARHDHPDERLPDGAGLLPDAKRRSHEGHLNNSEILSRFSPDRGTRPQMPAGS